MPETTGIATANPHPGFMIARALGALTLIAALATSNIWLPDVPALQSQSTPAFVLTDLSLEPEPVALQELSPEESALSISIDPGDFRLSEVGPEPSEVAEDAEEENEGAQHVLKVRNGDTLLDLFVGVGISRAQAHDAVSALRTVFNPRDLKVGQEITLTVASPATKGESVALLAANFAARADLDINLSREPDGRFTALQRDRELRRQMIRTTGTLRSSLFDAGSAAGVPGAVMVEFIRAFSYDVDFQRDIQQGDQFEIVFERYRDGQGRFAKDGNILYGAITLSGQTKKIYRYTPGDGPADYYNEKGESVRKALLRTPIDGARLTSGFGSRNHPILGYSAMHKGVDFGAPQGTPIQAAGDGVIEQAGWNGSYGNYARVRHNSEFTTAYAHMSRLGANVRAGQRVRQGQIIGYVGSTGRSTGPHLHYEIIRRGAQVNPMSVQAPIGRKLEGPSLVRFREARADIDLQVAGLAPATRIARNP